MTWLWRRNQTLERELAISRQALEHYAGVCHSAPVAFLTLDHDGVIGEINPEAAALLGGEAEAIKRRNFSEMVDTVSAPLWSRIFGQVKTSQQPLGCELTLKRADGARFLASLDLRSTQPGKTPAICLHMADIAARKRTERDDLEWQQEMAELRKGQIAAQTAAAIAHELNQPLIAISNYSEAAIKLLNMPLPDLHKVAKAVRGCERQAHRAGKSIYELLDFLSLKEVPAEAFDLNQVIADVLHTARTEYELDFESVLSLEEQLPLVFANRLHIEKVLLNLVRNAIEAMHESNVKSPEITVMVRTKADEQFAQVTIQDNGPGVREEIMQQLFRPFFTTKARGIGMGLAVSRSLVEANGGQLWVDPAETPGATFHLTLPLVS